MSPSLSNKKALVYDWGSFGHTAANLATEFAEVWYHVPWVAGYPTSKPALIGKDLETQGVERVRDFDAYVDKADLIVFPDCYCYDRVDFLRRHGYRVWGAGKAEELEIERIKAKTIIAEAGLPSTDYEIIKGFDKLRKYVAAHPKDIFIKGSLFRGDIETYQVKDLASFEAWIDKEAQKLGRPRQETVEFIVEQKIDGVEFGYDDSTVDGQFSGITAWGYENKDLGYIGQVCDYDDLPKPLKIVNAALAPWLRDYGARTFFHSEVRWGKEKKPYLIDPCLRSGNPPSQTLYKILGNWPQRIWAGADGENVDHTKLYNFGAQIQLYSPWCETDFLPVTVEKEAEDWIILKNATILHGQRYIVPTGQDMIGAAIGAGDTLKEACEMALKHARMISGMELEYDATALDGAMEQLKEGRDYGIQW
jgi:hypothetical protein